MTLTSLRIGCLITFYRRQVKMSLILFHNWFASEWVFAYSISLTLCFNQKKIKIQEKNMSCERALNFDQ